MFVFPIWLPKFFQSHSLKIIILSPLNVLYPITLLYIFVLEAFPPGFLVILYKENHVNENKTVQFFPVIYMNYISFSYFSCTHWTFSIMLKRGVNSKHPCLFPTLMRGSIQHLSIKYDVRIGYFIVY